MDPDLVTILDILNNLLCEQQVYLLVSRPRALVECDLTRVVVEERPED